MTMGPEPRIRIFEMSVRLGIMQLWPCFEGARLPFCFERVRFCFEVARLQPRRLMLLLTGALAPEGLRPPQIRSVLKNINIRLHARTDACAPGSHECI